MSGRAWPWMWTRWVRQVADDENVAFDITDERGNRVAVLLSAQMFDRLMQRSEMEAVHDV